MCNYDKFGHNCQEVCIEGSAKCMFHDETFLDKRPENKEIVKKQFIQKIEEAKPKDIQDNNSVKKTLDCTGYFLPDVRLTGTIPFDVIFSSTTFEGEANFRGAEFTEKANFWDVKFTGEAYFGGAEFTGTKNDFSYSIFKSSAVFSTNFSKRTLFRNTKFKNQDLINFDGDLSGVSFLHTDITRVRFGDDVKWGEVRNNDSDYGMVYDEWRIKTENPEEKIDIKNIITTYRFLRENYEFYLKYEQDGNFFVRESEIARLYEEEKTDDKVTIKKRSLWKLVISPATWYKVVADYGESYTKPAGWIVLLFVTGLAYFTYNGVITDGNILSRAEIFEDAFKRTIAASMPYFGMSENSNLADYGLKIAILPLLGMLFVSLKRKFERKHRH